MTLAQTPVPTMLKIAGVNKRFGGLQALADVSVDIQQGQI